MTIPEAAQLVIQAGAMGKGGEIYIFDMGEPVKIMDLAVKMIKLAGYEPEEDIVKELHLITGKPVMYVANVDENGLENNPHLDAVKEYAAAEGAEGAEVVAICAAIEAEIAQLDEDDKKEFLADLGFDEPGLNRVIRTGYKLLGLETFFTAGPKEVRAWTTKIGATAPEAAGEIHTDFQKGFIRAEVIAYDDFVTYQGEHGAKEAGRLRLEGKEYVVKEADVMHFRFNV